MSKDALKAALSVSLEEMEAEENTSGDLLETLVQEANDLTPEQYVEDRIAVEQDIQLIDAQADQLNDAVDVSHEQLDSAIALVNAVAGRYNGFKLKSTGLEGFGDAKERVAPTVAQLRELSVALESALDVTMESYSITDLWDKIGLLNREVPQLKDNVSVLKNYAGQTAKLPVTPAFGRSLIYAFRVDGSVPDNIPKAAGETASIIADLIKFGNQLVDDSKKAGELAMRTDWSDEAAVAKAITAINAIKPPIDEVYRRFDETFTMGNRRLNVKKFEIKGAQDLSNWKTGASLNVSWPKSTLLDLVFDPGIVMVVQGGRKRTVKIDELVGALDKFVSAASATQQMRSNSPKKWQEHNQLKTRMKKDVKGSAEAKAVQRSIVETSRLGWQCMNGAVTVLYFIIREINLAAERVQKNVRKNNG